jgi:ATP-dependent protease Clp ATPase subunit
MDNELFQHVTTQDFIEYGFEPEFIGPFARTRRL